MFWREAGRFDVMDREEERRVFEEYQRASGGRRDALAQIIVNSNLRLVMAEAGILTNRGVDYLDLVQVGVIGLITAVKKFDPERGYRFSTLAVWWVRQAMTREIFTFSSRRPYRTPPNTQIGIHRISFNLEAFRARYGRNPTLDELHKFMGQLDRERGVNPLTKRAVERYFALLLRRTINSESRVGLKRRNDDGPPLRILEALPDPGASAEAASLVREECEELPELAEEIEDAINRLIPRDSVVVRRRQGMGGQPKETLQEIGDSLGLSRERIRQLEARARRRIKQEVGLSWPEIARIIDLQSALIETLDKSHGNSLTASG
jgi:RNA polymerase primary sigma factor